MAHALAVGAKLPAPLLQAVGGCFGDMQSVFDFFANRLRFAGPEGDPQTYAVFLSAFVRRIDPVTGHATVPIPSAPVSSARDINQTGAVAARSHSWWS